jgi:dienelactone hydrolase
MIVDLVHTTAPDGMRLDGALHAAVASPSRLTVDALVCLHGVGSSFYGSALFERVTPALLDQGVSMLWANTRGHDAVHNARVAVGPRRQGAAYESVDECRLDVAAWLDFLNQRGFERVGILGHSLGAIKAVYSQAHQPHQQTACVIAASPPRLSYACFCQGAERATFLESFALAEQRVQEGRGGELIEARFPFPILITAAGYIDKYGPAERYNIIRFASRVRSAMLFTYGGKELASGGIAFAGVPEALAGLPQEGQRLAVATIPAADHNYTGKHAELAAVMTRWLAG